MRRSKLFGICFLCILFVSFASLASARTVNNMEELQTALASKDAEITLEAETYYGNLDIDYSVSLIGKEGATLIASPDALEGEYDIPEDVPVIAVHSDGESTPVVSISNIDFTTSGDIETSIAVIAGENVDLTLTDCVISGDFTAGVVVTNLDDIFKLLGDVYFGEFYVNSMPEGTPTTPAHLTMTGCTLSNYYLTGVAILGQGVTADISDTNKILGNPEFDLKEYLFEGPSKETMATQSVAGSLYGLLTSLANPATFSAAGPSIPYFLRFPVPITGIVVANGVDDEVRIYDKNTISGNYFGVITAKNVFVDTSELVSKEMNASKIEAGTGLSLEDNNTISNNVVGVTAVGGLEAVLMVSIPEEELVEDFNSSYSPPSIDFDLDDISLNDETTPLSLYMSKQNIQNNLIGSLFAGKIYGTVDTNIYSGDIAASLVGLGDLSDTYITDNEFNGITGAAMVFALQEIDINAIIGELDESSFDISQARTLTVSGNTITGNGSIEGIHDMIDDYFGLTPDAVVGEAIALGQRTADYGPLALLPSASIYEDVSLAGIVLLDGARNISIEENTIAGTLLGITAIDTGIVEDIQKIDIVDNTVKDNICGLTLVGAGKILVPLVEDYVFDKTDFMSADNKLVLGEVSGNSFSDNHIGMISALSVEGEIHNNYFDDNALLGMVHIGIGDWVLGLTRYALGYRSTEEIFGDIYPKLSIKRNNITGNGTNPENGPAFLNEVISDDIKYKDMLCGGILVIDSAKTDGLTINENNIAGNGSYGIITTTRKSYTEFPFAPEAEETTENEILDATSNWWGDPSGPGSYAPGSQTAPGYSDPVTKTIANGSGDPIGTFLVGIDGVYVPYSISASESSDPEVEVLFFSPEENIINFSKYSSTEFAIEPVSSSGGGFCGVASFTPSLLLLLAPLAFMLRRK